MTAGALERAVRRAGQRERAAAEHCELCGSPVPEEHRHLLDTSRAEVMCTCRPCALLFDRDVASLGHFRLVPERRVALTDVSPRELGAPVGLAFFVKQPHGTVIAHYPSPMGATRWEVDPQAWSRVVAACPVLADLTPEVEALLVNTARGAEQRWLVPIDECYRLVAVVKTYWKGLSGGGQVWTEIEAFFGGLARRAAGHHSPAP